MFFSSCYKDNSNKIIKNINPITIYVNGEEYIKGGNVSFNATAYFKNKLTISTLVLKEGTPDPKLKFTWTVSGNGVPPTVIGNSMTLDCIIEISPQSNAYNLVYSIVDTETGIQRHINCALTILSSLSQGLIVADTRDEATSDLSLISARNFNSSVLAEESKTFKDVWSDYNNGKIDGKVIDFYTVSYGTNRSLTVLTENDIIRADHYDFIKIQSESGMGIFIVPPKKLVPQFIGYDSSWGQELMSVNGKLYPRSCQNGVRMYNYYMLLPDYSEYEFTYFHNVRYSKSWMYDKLGERLILHSGKNLLQFKTQDPLLPFDVNNLKGCEPLYIGQTSDSEIHFVNKKNGVVYDYVMYCNVDDNGQNIPKYINDLSGCIDIDNAKYFTSGKLEDVLYYATDTEIYAAMLNSRTPLSELRYTAKVGEKITSIKVWSESAGSIRYKNNDPSDPALYKEMGTTDRMMVITTYNETTKEGKVITIPIVTLGIGGLEESTDFHVEYGGFGRILKVGMQNK